MLHELTRDGVRPDDGKHRMGVLTVCLLGIGRIVGARCKYWNEGLKIGHDYFFIFAGVECLGMILLGSCLAEMAGALPFTGGAYGFARGIYGPYLGFFVGIMEIITNVSGLASIVVAFAQACIYGLGLDILYFPLFFILLFVITAMMQFLTSSQYTHVAISLTIVSIILTIIYTFGSISHMDYSTYAYNSDIPRTSILDILSYAPIPTYFFSGIEMLPILGHFAKEPRRAIAYGLGATVMFGVLTMSSMIVVAVGQSPGIVELQGTSLPLNFGFANIFGISPQLANWFNIPLLAASFMIGEYFLCIILRSMAESGLIFVHFKHWFAPHVEGRPFPVRAMIVSYVLMIMFSMVIFGVLYYSFEYIMNLSYFVCLCFYALYICLFLTYISFSQRFPLIPRYYVSPVGIVGAYLGIAVYLFMAVMTLLYSNGLIVFGVWFAIIALLTVAYLKRIRPNETFSGEEERVFFIAYVIKSNHNSRKRIAKRASLSKKRKLNLINVQQHQKNQAIQHNAAPSLPFRILNSASVTTTTFLTTNNHSISQNSTTNAFYNNNNNSVLHQNNRQGPILRRRRNSQLLDFWYSIVRFFRLRRHRVHNIIMSHLGQDHNNSLSASVNAATVETQSISRKYSVHVNIRMNIDISDDSDDSEDDRPSLYISAKEVKRHMMKENEAKKKNKRNGDDSDSEDDDYDDDEEVVVVRPRRKLSGGINNNAAPTSSNINTSQQQTIAHTSQLLVQQQQTQNAEPSSQDHQSQNDMEDEENQLTTMEAPDGTLVHQTNNLTNIPTMPESGFPRPAPLSFDIALSSKEPSTQLQYLQQYEKHPSPSLLTAATLTVSPSPTAGHRLAHNNHNVVHPVNHHHPHQHHPLQNGGTKPYATSASPASYPSMLNKQPLSNAIHPRRSLVNNDSNVALAPVTSTDDLHRSLQQNSNTSSIATLDLPLRSIAHGDVSGTKADSMNGKDANKMASQLTDGSDFVQTFSTITLSEGSGPSQYIANEGSNGGDKKKGQETSQVKLEVNPSLITNNDVNNTVTKGEIPPPENIQRNEAMWKIEDT